MYVLSCGSLISFLLGGGGRAGRLSSFMHLSGPSRAIKFLYAPACSPPPTVWALKPPSWALVQKTTYAPVIYTSLFWVRAYPLLGQVGGGWALEILSFLGPKGHLPISSMSFRLENSQSRAQPSPTCLRNGYARIQNIMHGAV
jgi:hypothetical protein